MDKSFIVSVIIPLYNTEEYVEEAVRSIMSQTLKDLEIVIINDGSTDNSLAIVNKLAEEDSRISIYSQENKGLSLARNRGLSFCKGKYLYFMDSDDILEKGTLEHCFLKCEAEELDFVCFDAEIIDNYGDYQLGLSYKRDSVLKENVLYTGEEIFKVLLQHKSYSTSPCLYLVRSSYLKALNLLFYPRIIHEDQLFTTMMYLQAKRVQYIAKSFFKRRVRENSIMTRTFSMRNMQSYFIVADELIGFSNLKIDVKELVDTLLSQMLNDAVWLSYKMPFSDRVKIAQKCILKYKKYVRQRNLLILLFKSFIKK